MDLDEFFGNWREYEARRRRHIGRNAPPPLSPYPPLIINACLTGMVPTKRSAPFVPISVDEVIEDAIRVYDAGARIVHIHARDEDGAPTPRPLTMRLSAPFTASDWAAVLCHYVGRSGSSFESRSRSSISRALQSPTSRA